MQARLRKVNVMKQYKNIEAEARPDADRAVQFLEEFASGHPVSVAAIVPDKQGGVSGETFTLPDQKAELREWIKHSEGKAGLYYSLNAADPKRERIGKCGRLSAADVAWIRGVAVDLDPRKGEDFAAERERLLKLARDEESNVFGAPTYIVDSGGGIQMIWLFKEPPPNNPETAADVKAHARGLEAHFGSDGVHNLDRLFRMPWTTNIPNKSKRERGRIKRVAKVFSASGDRYDLKDLRNFAEPAAPKAESSGAIDQQSLLAPSIEDLKEVMAFVPNTTERFPDRRDFVEMAYAIKAAAGEENEDIARDLFLDWSDRYDGLEGNEPDFAKDTFDSLRPPFRVGWPWLLSHAPEWAGKQYFQPIDLRQLTEDEKMRDMFDTRKGSGATEDVFETLDLDEIENLKDPVFLIDRHLPEKSFCLLYGDPGAGKSFIALDMALHVAYALPDWHGDKVSENPGCVFYIASEGVAGLKSRIAAWKKKHLLPQGTKPKFELIRQSINFLEPPQINKLARTIEAKTEDPVALIVVDTVSRSIPGADENLQKDMTRFVEACDRLRGSAECCVLGIHHTSKAGEMRGSSVFLGQADAVFRLGDKGGEKNTGRDRGRVIPLTCTKQKDAPDGWHDIYALETVELENGGSSLIPQRLQKPKSSERERRENEDYARVVLGVMGESDCEKWADIRDKTRDAVNAMGLTDSKSGQHLNKLIPPRFEGLGVDVLTGDGQTVNLSARRANEKAPWFFHRTVVPETEVECCEVGEDA